MECRSCRWRGGSPSSTGSEARVLKQVSSTSLPRPRPDAFSLRHELIRRVLTSLVNSRPRTIRRRPFRRSFFLHSPSIRRRIILCAPILVHPRVLPTTSQKKVRRRQGRRRTGSKGGSHLLDLARVPDGSLVQQLTRPIASGNAQIQALEILLINRQTPLRSSSLTLTASSKDAATNSKKDYSYIRKSLFSDKHKAFKEAVAAVTGGSGKAAAMPTSGADVASQSQAKKNRESTGVSWPGSDLVEADGLLTSEPAPTPGNTVPIIVISSSPTSLITIWNAKKFFEEGVYVRKPRPASR